jgi:leucyl aminopeptidase
VTPPANGSASSTLTLTASSSAAAGTANVTVTGTSGALSHRATISLTVNSSGGGGGQTATYNSTLKAPSCGTVGSSCDSGVLLVGRDSMSGGAEPNQPNTINNSCADGTSGTFHSAESNDRLVVATTDGSNFAAGKTVSVRATVWAYNTSDVLDLYYAANANSPNWVYIKTLVPSGSGAQTLSTTYTLPSGSLQAVRANFRYQGSASPCSTGSYDDHDDLIFAVH